MPGLRVLYTGARQQLVVVFAAADTTTSDACKAWDALDDSTKKKFFATMHSMDSVGIHNFRNPERFKHVDDGIYEFKEFRVRLYCFRDGNRLLITNIQPAKKKDRADPADLKRAKERKAEWKAENTEKKHGK